MPADDPSVPPADAAEEAPPADSAAAPADQERPGAEQPEEAVALAQTDRVAALEQRIAAHEALMIQWFETVRQDLSILYYRIFPEEAAEPPAAATSEPRPDATASSGTRPPAADDPSREVADDAGGFDVRQAAAAAAEQIGELFQGATRAAQTATPAGPDASTVLEQAVFPEPLRDHAPITPDRQQLLADLLAAGPDAVNLAGCLMIAQAADAERLPVLLKDLGEAYYRWRPRGDQDRFRDALTQWLESRCAALGTNNRIEIVRAGDRFDSKRHNARQAGIEIAGVHGWIVLRENGKVYTKANVAVR